MLCTVQRLNNDLDDYWAKKSAAAEAAPAEAAAAEAPTAETAEPAPAGETAEA